MAFLNIFFVFLFFRENYARVCQIGYSLLKTIGKGTVLSFVILCFFFLCKRTRFSTSILIILTENLSRRTCCFNAICQQLCVLNLFDIYSVFIFYLSGLDEFEQVQFEIEWKKICNFSKVFMLLFWKYLFSVCFSFAILPISLLIIKYLPPIWRNKVIFSREALMTPHFP